MSTKVKFFLSVCFCDHNLFGVAVHLVPQRSWFEADRGYTSSSLCYSFLSNVAEQQFDWLLIWIDWNSSRVNPSSLYESIMKTVPTRCDMISLSSVSSPPIHARISHINMNKMAIWTFFLMSLRTPFFIPGVSNIRPDAACQIVQSGPQLVEKNS